MVSLTRRGWGTLGVVVACVWMGSTFGWRSLLAVVVPLGLSVVAGAVSVRYTDRPALRRVVPEDGFVGETRDVELDFETDTPVSGVVHDDHGPGVSATGNRVDTTVGNGAVGYELTFENRGIHDLGPATLVVTDVLGLATRTFEYLDRDRVVAYPRVYELSGASRSELTMLADGALDREREEFDRLREYRSGDSLRDIHWKSSAKQPQDDLVVKEFVAEDDVGDVVVAIEATEGNADRMAEAAVSLVMHFLSMGIAVGVDFPGGRSLDPDAGADHRTRLLEGLARVQAGNLTPGQREAADVVVLAEDDGVTVRVEDRETTFASLAGLEEATADSVDAGRRDASARAEVFP